MKLRDLLYEMPDLTLVHEDHAVNAAITLPDFNPRYAKVVGTMDGFDVWLTRYFGDKYNAFAFRDGEELLAFIVTGADTVDGAYPLVRMWSSPSHRGRGLTTALILFVTKKLNSRLMLTADEPLTDEGWNWLTKAVQRGKIKAIDANSGQPLSAQDIGLDKQKQRDTGSPTELTVVIERDTSKYDLFGSGGYRQLQEKTYVIDSPGELE